MIDFSRKTIASFCNTVAAAVVIVAGITMRTRFMESWYVHRLESGDEKAQREAAEKLSAIGSTKALRSLLDVFASVVKEERLVCLLDRRRGELRIDRVTVCVPAYPPTQPIGQTRNLRPVSEVAPLIKTLVGSMESIAKREGRRGLRILDEGLDHPNEQIRWVSALLLRRMGSAEAAARNPSSRTTEPGAADSHCPATVTLTAPSYHGRPARFRSPSTRNNTWMSCQEEQAKSPPSSSASVSSA